MTLSDTAAAPVDADAFAADWNTWHQEHEIRRADPHGFLAIAGLHWLDASPQRFSRIDASQDRESVWRQIDAVLRARGW